MKSILITTFLILSFGLFSKTGTKSEYDNNEGRKGDYNTFIGFGPNAAQRATEEPFLASKPQLHAFPKPNSIISKDANLFLIFNDFMIMDSINSKILVNSSVYGLISGTWTRNGRKLSFEPDQRLIGEVTVTITNQLTGEFGRWKPQELIWSFFVPVTLIPDANFEQALIDLRHDDELDGWVYTSDIDHISYLHVKNKDISDLTGIEDFSALEKLYCDNNNLSSLYVSENLALTALDCSFNQLTSLDVSANTLLTELNSISNSDLTCIEVSKDQHASIPSGWNKDPWSSYSENCAQAYTYVPDDNFEQALIDFGYDEALDNYVATDAINVITTLNVSGRGISDLTGIEDFASLTLLYCHKNQLSSLDVSANTSLTTLRCYDNQLASLNVSKNAALTSLHCAINQLTSLDVSANTALRFLNCRSNQLTSLDVSTNTALTNLYCYNNQLSGLDLSVNTELIALHCYNNQLAILDVSNSTELTDLKCSHNQLISLDVSNNTKLTDLNCRNNQLTTLDVSANIALTSLHCAVNQLTSLDVSKNTALKHLNCRSNQLTSLDVSKNTALTNLYSYNNQLSGLDLSVNTELKALHCYNNQLAILDVSNNTELTDLICYNNQLVSLDVSNNTKLTNLNCRNNRLTTLDVSANFALTSLHCAVNQLASLDVSNNAALSFLSCHSNQLTSLDISTNIVLTSLNSTSNSDLTCIEVNEDQLANIPAGWGKDSWAEYSLDCSTSMRKSEDSQLSEEVNTTFLIYPNPARSEVTLSLGAPEKVHSIHFTDMAGKLIKAYDYQQREMSQITLGLEGITSGLYFVEIVTTGGVMKQRLSVIK